jgi:oligopeptide transport system substrate-binding protein
MSPATRPRLARAGAALRRLALAAGLAAALPLLLQALAAPAQAAQRVVHRAGTDDATTLDPHKVGYPGETTIMSDLFVGLTTLDAEARPIPGCAESWSVSRDGLTWTFRMRPGLRWSDGSALTAADFEWSLRRALRPETAFPFAGRLFMVRNARAVSGGSAPVERLGVRATDPRTLVIELEHPAPYLDEVLATFAMPVPRRLVEARGAAWIAQGSLVSNGPFVLEEWRPNAFIRLRRNPNFYDAANVPADAVMHYPVTQPTTAIRRFQAGELDFVLSVPAEQVERLREQFGSQLKIDLGIGLEALAFNVRRGPTRDLRVRRALSMAIDRDALARNVLREPRQAAYGYVSPGVSRYPSRASVDFATWPAAKRQAEARRLLQEAGFGPANPLRLRLAFPANDINRRIAVVLDAMWRQAGVRAELQAKEQRALVADIARGEFDAARVLWLSGHTDPMAFLERLDGGAAGTTTNPSGYVSARYDGLVADATRERDVGRRAALLREAEAVALADQPVAPLYWFVGRRLVSPALTGWAHNARGIHLSRFMGVPAR